MVYKSRSLLQIANTKVVSKDDTKEFTKKYNKKFDSLDNIQKTIRYNDILIDGNVKWYKCFVKNDWCTSVLKEYTHEQLEKSFIVSIGLLSDKDKVQNDDGPKKQDRLFAVFKDYISFYDYSQTFHPNARSFYEIIMGRSYQKPHFDIDIDKNEFMLRYNSGDYENDVQSILDSLIRSCIEVLKLVGVNIDVKKNILLYSSHSKNKKSFHLIIDKYCHTDNLEAREFRKKVMNYFVTICDQKFNDGYFITSPFIDPKVYSGLQQFRILGCQKRCSNRPKLFNREFQFEGNIIKNKQSEKSRNEQHQDLIDLSKSLISFTSECTPLPPFLSEDERRAIRGFGNETIPDEVVKMALEAYKLYWKNMNDSDYIPYKVLKVHGKIIILKRLSPSMCEICKRIHENENPFLFILGNKVCWNCRRCEYGESIVVGEINIESGHDYDLSENDSNIMKDYGIIIIYLDEESENSVENNFENSIEEDIIIKKNEPVQKNNKSCTIINRNIKAKEKEKMEKQDQYIKYCKSADNIAANGFRAKKNH